MRPVRVGGRDAPDRAASVPDLRDSLNAHAGRPLVKPLHDCNAPDSEHPPRRPGPSDDRFREAEPHGARARMTPPARRQGVLVFGSLNMDLVARVPRLPRPGETLSGESL